MSPYLDRVKLVRAIFPGQTVGHTFDGRVTQLGSEEEGSSSLHVGINIVLLLVFGSLCCDKK